MPRINFWVTHLAGTVVSVLLIFSSELSCPAQTQAPAQSVSLRELIKLQTAQQGRKLTPEESANAVKYAYAIKSPTELPTAIETLIAMVNKAETEKREDEVVDLLDAQDVVVRQQARLAALNHQPATPTTGGTPGAPTPGVVTPTTGGTPGAPTPGVVTPATRGTPGAPTPGAVTPTTGGTPGAPTPGAATPTTGGTPGAPTPGVVTPTTGGTPGAPTPGAVTPTTGGTPGAPTPGAVTPTTGGTPGATNPSVRTGATPATATAHSVRIHNADANHTIYFWLDPTNDKWNQLKPDEKMDVQFNEPKSIKYQAGVGDSPLLQLDRSGTLTFKFNRETRRWIQTFKASDGASIPSRPESLLTGRSIGLSVLLMVSYPSGAQQGAQAQPRAPVNQGQLQERLGRDDQEPGRTPPSSTGSGAGTGAGAGQNPAVTPPGGGAGAGQNPAVTPPGGGAGAAVNPSVTGQGNPAVQNPEVSGTGGGEAQTPALFVYPPELASDEANRVYKELFPDAPSPLLNEFRWDASINKITKPTSLRRAARASSATRLARASLTAARVNRSKSNEREVQRALYFLEAAYIYAIDVLQEGSKSLELGAVHDVIGELKAIRDNVEVNVASNNPPRDRLELLVDARIMELAKSGQLLRIANEFKPVDPAQPQPVLEPQPVPPPQYYAPQTVEPRYIYYCYPTTQQSHGLFLRWMQRR